jgi:hypothetical protein
MEQASGSCLGFSLECGTLLKGAGVTLMGLILFVGSVYLLLSAVFGRWMGYLVLMVAFSGWMVLHSALWLFGFWSQGMETPTNLGPRGSEPAWVILDGGFEVASERFSTFESYPSGPWDEPSEGQTASVQSVGSAATTFLAEQANEELGRDPLAADAITGTQFTVDSVRFADAEDDKTSLAVVQAHFTGGGPLVTLSLYHDSGSIPRYSFMFLAGSIVLFAIHLPLLDRAEKKRKEFITGGSAPAWYGPA